MRVTELQTFGVLTNNLARARARGLEFQQQVSTGKLVRQPSDDPSAFNHIALDKASLAAIEQRKRNIVFGQTRLDLSDTALSHAMTSLSRVQQLAVQFRNDTNSAADRVIGAKEVRQLFAQLQQTANTELSNQPIFTGTSTHGRATGLAITAPLTLTNGSNDTLTVTVDGTTSGTIDLTAGTESLTGAQLVARVQSRINADTALINAGKSVTVTFEDDRLIISSDLNGSQSTVRVTGGLARAAVGFAGGSETTGGAPFALTATVASAVGNTGGALAGQGRVVDDNTATLDDYVIRFTSPASYDVLNVTAPVATSRGAANTGDVAVRDAGMVNAAQLTLHNYQIQFTSPTQYSVVDQMTSTTLSSGNTYLTGEAISFAGMRVVLANGQQGGPQTGDTFSVSLSPRNVLANQTYVSGSEISFEGLRMTLTNGGSAPATGDLFSIVSGLQYQGDAGVHAIEVGTDQTVPTNVAGSRAFIEGGIDIFAEVKQLVSALRGNYRLGISDALGQLNQGVSQIAAIQGEVGATSNRLTTSAAQLEEAKSFFIKALSETEDVDLAKAISDLTLQQYAIEAASRTLTKMFESSLLNYI
ncbi:MAG: flagellin N-terminal helical domain-containing protein [Nitrospiraceae bacterium]